MMKIPYLDYKELSGYYTVQNVANMLGISTQKLVDKCDQYGIQLQIGESGVYGLNGSAIKKLHYRLYHESRGKNISDIRRDEPWA